MFKYFYKIKLPKRAKNIFEYINSCFSEDELRLLETAHFQKILKRKITSIFCLGGELQQKQRVEEVINRYKFLFISRGEIKEIRNLYIKKILEVISISVILEISITKYKKIYKNLFETYKRKPGDYRQSTTRYWLRMEFSRHLYFFPVDLITKEIEVKYPLFTKINPLFSGLIRRYNGMKINKKTEEECREFGHRLLKEYGGYIYSTSQTEYSFKAYEALLSEVRKFFNSK